MAPDKKTNLEKFKRGLLIAFLGVCCIMIMLTLAFSLAESVMPTTVDEGYRVNRMPTATATPNVVVTIDPNTPPTPTLAYWEIQE